jgi:hypothetical protein
MAPQGKQWQQNWKLCHKQTENQSLFDRLQCSENCTEAGHLGSHLRKSKNGSLIQTVAAPMDLIGAYDGTYHIWIREGCFENVSSFALPNLTAHFPWTV